MARVKTTPFYRLICNLDKLVDSRDSCDHFENALVIQCKIHHQVCLLQWLLQLKNQPMEQQGDGGESDARSLDTEWMALQIIMEAVGATSLHLKSMSIPPNPSRFKRIENCVFYDYLELPQLARQHILDQLILLEDKLNLIIAVPGEAEIMRWTRVALKLEIGFTKRLKEKPDIWISTQLTDQYRNMDPKRVGQMLNREFDTCLEKNLVEDENNYRIIDLMNTLGEFGWSLETHPLLVHVQVDLGSRRNQEWKEKEKVLEKVGKRIWYLECCLVANGLSAREAIVQLQNLLGQMPNLRKLRISGIGDNADVAMDEFVDEPLPELRFLRSLVIIGGANETIEMIQRKLVQKYGAGVNQLALKVGGRPVVQTLSRYAGYKLTWVEFEAGLGGLAHTIQLLGRNFGATLKHLGLSLNGNGIRIMGELNQLPVYKVLSSLKLTWGLRRHETLFCRILGWFGSASLTQLEVALGSEPWNRLWDLPEILLSVARHFAGTMEEMKLTLRRYWNDDRTFSWNEEMAEVSFPRMKRLEVKGNGFEDELKFLLIFPNLEKVKLDHVNWVGEEEIGSWVESLWKLLPYLEEIHMDGNVVSNRSDFINENMTNYMV